MTKQFSLGAVLDKFRSTQGATNTTKTATDKEVEKVAGAEDPAEKAEEPVEKVAEAEELTDAAVLKGIAKEAAEVEKVAQDKEASEFGKLFAHSFMEELEIQGTIKEASESAYNATMETVHEMDMHVKLASIYDEARELTHLSLIEKSAYDVTCDTLTKHAEEQLPTMLLTTTKEAYDNTLEALGYEV